MNTRPIISTTCFVLLSLTATRAFAHFDVERLAWFLLYVIATFHVLLGAVMFVSGAPLKRRFKFLAFYLISLVVFWTAVMILKDALKSIPETVFILLPVGLVITFRYFLSHRIDGTRRADAG